ncbi:MAG TPA: pyrroloquinoline quinone biosynthesis protein PqqE, partial [Methyloceanibacter sp.]
MSPTKTNGHFETLVVDDEPTAGVSGTSPALCARAPVGLLAELTHRCPLQCSYCSNPLELERVNKELTTAEWVSVMEQAGAMGILQVHLSGGEPTARKDLEDIVSAASKAGLYTNLITAAVTLTRPRLEELVRRGLDHVQISFQDVDAENAERIGAYPGATQKKLDVAHWVTELGLPLTINAPIHRQNIHNVPRYIELALELGAQRLEIAHVQYYGWAYLNRAALIPTYEQTIESIEFVERERERLKGVLTIDMVVPDYYAKRPKPCMGGWGKGFMNITPAGKVLPCHVAETIKHLSFDNVKDRKLLDIWLNSDAFNAFRGTEWMKEPCRSCAFREIDWGGCRCQAMAI